MSVGPTGGIPASAAGSPLAQTQGAELDRLRQQTASQQRRTQMDQKAENASGVGQTDGEDHETAERDADGRRLWEEPTRKLQEQPEGSAKNRPQPKDPTGQCGNLLDISG